MTDHWKCSRYMNIHERDGSQATDLVECAEEAKIASMRVIEVITPRLEVLNAVEEHSVYLLVCRWKMRSMPA
jgi:hypothetical protein